MERQDIGVYIFFGMIVFIVLFGLTVLIYCEIKSILAARYQKKEDLIIHDRCEIRKIREMQERKEIREMEERKEIREREDYRQGIQNMTPEERRKLYLGSFGETK